MYVYVCVCGVCVRVCVCMHAVVEMRGGAPKCARKCANFRNLKANVQILDRKTPPPNGLPYFAYCVYVCVGYVGPCRYVRACVRVRVCLFLRT